MSQLPFGVSPDGCVAEAVALDGRGSLSVLPIGGVALMPFRGPFGSQTGGFDDAGAPLVTMVTQDNQPLRRSAGVWSWRHEGADRGGTGVRVAAVPDLPRPGSNSTRTVHMSAELSRRWTNKNPA